MRFSFSKLFLIAVTVLTVASCATRVPFVQDQNLTESDSANITIYRTRTSFHSLNPERPFVYVDAKEVGKLGVGQDLNLKLTAGEHRFSIREPVLFQPAYESKSLTVTIREGVTYYLRYSKEMSGILLPSA